MGVVLIKWAWPKNFARIYIYNPTILKILHPPLDWPCFKSEILQIG